MKMCKQAAAFLLAPWVFFGRTTATSADAPAVVGDIVHVHPKSRGLLEFTMPMPTGTFSTGIDSSQYYYIPAHSLTFVANESDPIFNRTAFLSVMTAMNSSAVVTESTDPTNQNSRQLQPPPLVITIPDDPPVAPILRDQEYLIGPFDLSPLILDLGFNPNTPIRVVATAIGVNSAAVVLYDATLPLINFDNTLGLAWYISPTSVIQLFSAFTGCLSACQLLGDFSLSRFHTLNQLSFISIRFNLPILANSTVNVVLTPTPVEGGGFGDPHIQTWQNDLFDYNGACDLVLLETPGFAAGLGLWVHIRTTIQEYYSYIQAVAVKIGNEILEVESGGGYYINGVKQEQPLHSSIGYDGEANQTIMGFPLRHNVTKKDRHTFEILMHPYGKISIHEYKDFLTVMIGHARAEHFQDSIGLMGNFLTGERLARDGVTNMMKEDVAAFGQEWQVRSGVDPLLFHSIREPQYPHACLLPTVTKEERIRRRKLRQNLRGSGANDVTEAQAAKACAGWDKGTRASCMEDVLVTGDLGMADQGGAR